MWFSFILLPTQRRRCKVNERFAIDEGKRCMRADFLNKSIFHSKTEQIYIHTRKLRPIARLEESVNLKSTFRLHIVVAFHLPQFGWSTK